MYLSALGTMLVVKPRELSGDVPGKCSHVDFMCMNVLHSVEILLLPSIQNIFLEEKWENKCLRGISSCLLLKISMLYNQVYNNCF